MKEKISRNKISRHYKSFFELDNMALAENDNLMIDWGESLIYELVNQEVEKRIAEKDELIVLLNAYATFLGKIIDKHATFLMVHGIKASDDEIKMGQKYRDDINRIVSRLVSQKTEGGGNG